jgi:hypothetical protein
MAFTGKDMVKSGGKIGGYLINPPKIQTGGNPMAQPILSGLQNLAVPLGLVYLQQTTTKTPATDIIKTLNNNKNKVAVISDSLYDRLLDLVTDKEKTTKNKTKKRKFQIKKNNLKTNKDTVTKKTNKKTKRRK